MENFTTAITQELHYLSVESEKQPELVCPKCKIQKLVIRDQLIKCVDENCNWILFRKICGIQLNIMNLEMIIHKGRTCLLKGMTSKSGKKFDAFIVMNSDGKTSFTFPEKTKRK